MGRLLVKMISTNKKGRKEYQERANMRMKGKRKNLHHIGGCRSGGGELSCALIRRQSGLSFLLLWRGKNVFPAGRQKWRRVQRGIVVPPLIGEEKREGI